MGSVCIKYNPIPNHALGGGFLGHIWGQITAISQGFGLATSGPVVKESLS